MAALRKRSTSREISSKKLPIQMLSNLLWSAFGVNRKIGPFGVAGRTAASASNSQEIELYVVLPEGVYFYEAFTHALFPVTGGDLRKMAIGYGQGGAGANAPMRIIYVADINKFAKAGFQEPGLRDPETQKAYYYVDTGLIAGNSAIFAASQGLASWFHNCNKPAITEKLKLRPNQRPLFAQTIGWPVKPGFRGPVMRDKIWAKIQKRKTL
jgi:nitroreductase